MLDYFEFKGERCTDYGIRVTKLPPITLAEERLEHEKITGRSGDLTRKEGDAVFNSMVLPVECYVENIEMLDSMGAWLRGEGKLVLPNREGGYYVGHMVNQIELERIVKAFDDRTFTLNFHVQPYFNLDNSKDITITAASQVITNPGTVESEPRITIHGSGDFGITIGSQLVILKNITDGIIMDTVLQDALSLDEAQLLNGNMAGDFIRIPAGRSVLAWYPFEDDDNPGRVTKIVITPRWRCR